MKHIAKALLKIKAVELSPESPFTWASGIKSPIYCDNRLLLSYPTERKLVIDAMISSIRENFPDVAFLMGTATAGIPHASICAWEMNLPTGFVRSKSKDHGKENLIEGRFQPGANIVVVEDLISTGGSSLSVVKAIEAAGGNVLGVQSIFTYEMKRAIENFSKAGVILQSLTNYTALLEAAIEENYIETLQLKKLQAFQEDPSNQSWMTL